MHSHMMKNSEWGAVAYLTHSQYGRNGNEIDINNSSSYITGNGGGSTSASQKSGTPNAYNTNKGVKASSTGNIYGIYDLSGGAWEYTAGFDKSGNSTYLTGLDYGLKLTQEAKDIDGEYTNTKYATTYSNGTELAKGNSIIYSLGKTGDSTKEVNTGGTEPSYSTEQFLSWQNDTCWIVDLNFPFTLRGGHNTSGTNSGVFWSLRGAGSCQWADSSFRTALTL